jgi:hypothetical protein
VLFLWLREDNAVLFCEARSQVVTRKHLFLCVFPKLPKVSINFFMFICLSAWNNSLPTGLMFMKFSSCVFFKILSRKSKFKLNRRRITDTLHEDVGTIMIISHWILLRIKNICDRKCKQNEKSHFISRNFFSQNRAVYEIMWENTVQPDRA